MPNYEPTPRRFSTLSVPQTPSRRNSFGDACRPSLAITDTPVFPPLASPLDLSILLKRLQQTSQDIKTTETDGDNVERGRSRQSARHKRSATALSHHDSTNIQVPAARKRENSASTRDRIAMWEERSRSQSKGRSKSRGRDLGHMGSRISVVPEMPEIASALAQLHHDRQTWANGMANSPPPSPETVSANADDRIDVLHIDRPQTPLATMPALLPTPDATPRQLVSGKRELSLSSVPAINPELADSPTLIRTSPSLPRNQMEAVATTVQIGVRFITEEAQEAPTLPPRPLGADGVDEPRTSNQDTWRISNYRPEFPLPARPTVQTLDHAILARAPFDGTPLQELPRSQPSGAAQAHGPLPESHTERRPDSYCDGKSGSGEGGDFAIDILPSPTSAHHRIPNDYRPAGQNPKQSRSGSSRRGKDVGAGGGRDTFGEVDLESGRSRHEWDTPPVIERAFHAASVSIFQSLAVPMGLYRGFRDNYYPPPERPDIIKAYPVRIRLPIRIFFPSHHDLMSPALLPTLFTIHGGGFTVGYASDDDKWNRTFADTYTIIVISLNYSKAPWACFPAPLHDVEALYHAVLNDESLPIDRMRTALSGFDAGANLALALSQLPSVQTGREPSPRPPPPAALDPKTTGLQSPTSPPSITRPSAQRSQRSQNLNRHRSIYFPTGGPSLLPQGYQPNPHPASFPYQPPPPLKSHPPPSAVIPICGILDFTTSASEKSKTRPYKRSLRGPRGWGPGLDLMARTLPSSAWSYIPYGHDTSDPLLSPFYAKRSDLPPHVFVIGAELDCLAHESWRAACSWAGGQKSLVLPGGDVMVGRKSVSRWRGCLDDGAGLDADKFGWVVYHGRETNEEEEEDKIVGSTRWLLVPDVVHGFDSAPWRNKYLWGDEQARMDAEMKTIAYQREMAEWLWGTVWK